MEKEGSEAQGHYTGCGLVNVDSGSELKKLWRHSLTEGCEAGA